MAPRRAEEKEIERLLTLDEAAEVLHVHKRTIERLVAARRLTVVRFRGAVRVDPADLRDFIDSHREQAEPVTRPGLRVARNPRPLSLSRGPLPRPLRSTDGRGLGDLLK